MANILLQFVFLVFLVGIINSIIGMFKIRKVLKEHKNDPNIKGIAIVNGEIKLLEKENGKALNTEKVNVHCCNKMVNKNDVYRSFIDGKEYYFCSWECMEKFRN